MNNLVLVSLAIMAFTTYCFGFHRFRLVKHALRHSQTRQNSSTGSHSSLLTPKPFFFSFSVLFTHNYVFVCVRVRVCALCRMSNWPNFCVFFCIFLLVLVSTIFRSEMWDK